MMGCHKKVKIKAALMAVTAVLALIAFISPISAVQVGEHDITFVDPHTFDEIHSTWTYRVTSGSQPSLSHWVIPWCNPDAIVAVSVPGNDWEYGEDPHTGITGIKFEDEYVGGVPKTVWFKLSGDFAEGVVEVGTKAGKDNIGYGDVTGPVNPDCNVPIPEFTTTALAVASIFGLLFFVNHRKHKKD